MSDGKDSLRRLRELTPQLPVLGSMVSGPVSHTTTYNTEGGPSLATNLFSIAEVAVCECHMVAGAKFTDHIHDVAEVLVVYEGELKMTFEGNETVLRQGDSLHLKPGTLHTAEALTEARMIAVAVPASPWYPRG
jgi:quercetin dioxygenase-like cupin family protein